MPSNIKIPLFFTRISIAYFLLPWVLMRFVKPESAKGIAAKYYKVSSMPDIAVTLIGVFWVLLLVAFVIGFKKRISYGLVLLFHTVGTLFTLPYLIVGTEKAYAVFFAAIPVIGAMWLLYAMREHDTFLTIGNSKSE